MCLQQHFFSIQSVHIEKDKMSPLEIIVFSFKVSLALFPFFALSDPLRI